MPESTATEVVEKRNKVGIIERFFKCEKQGYHISEEICQARQQRGKFEACKECLWSDIEKK